MICGCGYLFVLNWSEFFGALYHSFHAADTSKIVFGGTFTRNFNVNFKNFLNACTEIYAN